MKKIKTKEEVEVIRKGGKKLAYILDTVISEVRPGVKTDQLEEIACKLIKKEGGRPAFKYHMMSNGEPFPSALCISVNNEIVHAPAFPARVLNEGDIVGIDIGMEYPAPNKGLGIPVNSYSKLGGFYTDMSKTVAVGKISGEAQRLMDVTRESLSLGIKQVKPGNTLNDIGRAIQKHAESNGFSVVRELVGHGVGYDVHEGPQVPNYEIKDGSLKNEVLKTGMVIAIEPMVNIGDWRVEVGEDGMSIVTKDGSLSAHFEHTIAVTDDGHEILTVL